MRVLGAELETGDRVYVADRWLTLEDVGPSAEAEDVIEAFVGNRAVHFAPDGFYDRRARVAPEPTDSRALGGHGEAPPDEEPPRPSSPDSSY
jgi:hypothetical protein